MIKTPAIEGSYSRPASRLLALIAASFCFWAQPLWAGESDDEKAGSHVLRAEMELERQEYKAAAEEYRKAAELSEDPEVAKQATRVAYSYGFNDDALRAAKRWLELEEGNDEPLLYVAQLQLRTGALRDARSNFRRLLEKGEEPADERLPALIPFLSEEDAKDSHWLMRELAKPYKDSAAAHYAAGVMALQAGDAGEALKRAERAIELNEEWTQPHMLYSRALLLSGEQDAAVDYAARMVGDSPDPDPDARLELAIMYLSADRDDDALSQVNQVLLEQPARTDALRLMAIINFRQDHLDAAWADFQDLLASGRYTMDAYYYLGRIADRRQEYDEAVALYSRVIAGENVSAAQRRASGIMAQEGKPDEALAHLETFGSTHPNHAIDMMQARAQLLASLDRHEEALELYDRVVDYRPDDEQVTLGKAELLLRMGRVDDAIKMYRSAVKRWPDSAMSLNALGYTLADHTDRYREASRLIRKALDIEPDSPAIIDSWGWVLYKQGDYEQALAELERAYDVLKDPEVAAHLVEVLWKLDRSDEAKEVLEDAEVLFPENELLENIRERAFPDSR